MGTARQQAHAAHQKVQDLERQLAEAKAERDKAIRAAHQDGTTKYRLAKDLGLSQPTIARIIDTIA